MGLCMNAVRLQALHKLVFEINLGLNQRTRCVLMIKKTKCEKSHAIVSFRQVVVKRL
jgi:hypothetical protein